MWCVHSLKSLHFCIRHPVSNDKVIHEYFMFTINEKYFLKKLMISSSFDKLKTDTSTLQALSKYCWLHSSNWEVIYYPRFHICYLVCTENYARLLIDDIALLVIPRNSEYSKAHNFNKITFSLHVFGYLSFIICYIFKNHYRGYFLIKMKRSRYNFAEAAVCMLHKYIRLGLV